MRLDSTEQKWYCRVGDELFVDNVGWEKPTERDQLLLNIDDYLELEAVTRDTKTSGEKLTKFCRKCGAKIPRQHFL